MPLVASTDTLQRPRACSGLLFHFREQHGTSDQGHQTRNSLDWEGDELEEEWVNHESDQQNLFEGGPLVIIIGSLCSSRAIT